MKSAVSISAAMLLAMSLTACGNNDEQNDAAADTGDTAETNTATQNSDSAGGDMASDDMAGQENDVGGESQMDSNAGEGMSTDTGSAGGTSDMSGNGLNSASNEDMPKAAIAVLHGTQGNEDITATIRFTPQDGGIAYETEAQNLPGGEHGYHIHLYGDCSAPDGTSADTHFNLQGSSKNPPEDIDRITGDLGNIEGGDSASHEGMLDNASLTGAKSIVGRGVIIHEKPNDPSQPPIGAAGSRLACGVIGIADPEAANDTGSGGASDAMNNGSSAESDNAMSGSDSAGSSGDSADSGMSGDTAGGSGSDDAASGSQSEMGDGESDSSM